MPNYKVLQGLVQGQEAYEPGGRLDLSEEKARPLVRLGYLEQPVQETKERAAASRKASSSR